jgi:hypothetical protein
MVKPTYVLQVYVAGERGRSRRAMAKNSKDSRPTLGNTFCGEGLGYVAIRTYARNTVVTR